MNRILFERTELVDGCVTCADARAAHILDVLHGEVGQTLKTGEVDGLLGTGVIEAITDRAVTIRCQHDQPSLPPWVDLILAPPRPRVLKRLLPQLATLGVGRIFLVGAKKVEKDFWGATLLKEENYRPLFVDGLMQGCVSAQVPKLETRRNFRAFLRDECEALFPGTRRLVAHPYGDTPPPEAPFDAASPFVLAIGPEGGWTEEEVAALESHGFVRQALGPRILRTDTATVSLLARLMPTETSAAFYCARPPCADFKDVL